MNILWVTQVSSKDKNGKVKINSDSSLDLINGFLTSDMSKNCIIIAFEFAYSDLDESGRNYLQEMRKRNKNIDFVFNKAHHFTDAKTERFFMDYSFFDGIRKYVKQIDVVMLNEPTKALAIKSVFKDAKIVSYNSWLAFYNMPNLIYRQCEGMLESDYVLFNSHYAINETLSYYDYMLGAETLKHLKETKFKKFQPATPLELFKKNSACEKNFIYNHRLSTDEYYMNAFNDLLTVCNILEQKIPINEMPIIYFTNPSGKDLKQFEVKPYFRFLKYLDSKENYYNFLKSNKIIGHLNTFFKSKGMWAMSTVDAGICGNFCLLPERYGYAEIFDKDYIGYCDDVKEMANKMYSIIKDDFLHDLFSAGLEYLTNHNSKQIGNKLHALLNDIIK